MKNRVDDFLTNLKSIATVKANLTDEGQAQSVKRLTLLAAIFLPLSLASGLLSIGTRTADLGLIRYDYLRISTLLMFLVFIVYQLMRVSDYIQAAQATTTAKYLDQIKKRLPPRIWKKASQLVKFLFKGRIQAVEWVIVQHILHYSFAILFVASFWVGMFKDIGLGLKILGYGTAAWAGSLILLLLTQFNLCIIRLQT